VARRRRDSGDSASPVANLASRLGNRFPSLSRRLTDRKSAIATTPQGVRSAPISRAPSFRMPSLTKSLVTHLESRIPVTPPQTPIEAVEQPFLFPFPGPTSPIGIHRMEDPIDRQALASTPLLPPMITERRDSDSEVVQSPLQSPTVTEHASFAFPAVAPPLPSSPTPPLSSKPSVASLGMSRSTQIAPMAEVLPMNITAADDKWAAKLGHANFNIQPEPYLPEVCNTRACRQLTDDWESARRQYLSHAAHTSEHYGPRSQTLKFTEMKWSEIDAQWKRNHETVISRATANGESPINQPLAESSALTKMPSIDGPESKGKFPALDSTEIVGPMVQYAKIQQRPSKRSAFLKFFSDLRSGGSGSP